jgi:hypothetical protein
MLNFNKNYTILLTLCILVLFTYPTHGQRHSSRASRTATPTSTGGSVRVRSYIRRDGTYVQPSHRTQPDGNFNNNWSTRGNVNPYTSEEGKRDIPPAGYGSRRNRISSTLNQRTTTIFVEPRPNTLLYPEPSSRPSPVTSFSVVPRLNSKAHIPVNPTSSDSYLSSLDKNLRLRKAEQLNSLGYEVNWQEYSYLEMSDWELRIRKASDLKKIGIAVNWQKYSYLEMSDWELRIRKANDLRLLGIGVDWQQYSYLTMSDWELRIRKANQIKLLGFDVDWHKYSYLELVDLERSYRKK